jgi:hypothetical protein
MPSNHCLLVAVCLFIYTSAVSQNTSPGKLNFIKNESYYIDLCAPTFLKTVIKSPGRNRFEVNWKNTLSFGIINTNQFRYDYTLNSVPFSAFVDTTYKSFQNTILSAVDLKADPFFVFDVKSDPPHKLQFKSRLKTLDSLADLRLTVYEEYANLLGKYGYIDDSKFRNSKEFKIKGVEEAYHKLVSHLNSLDRLLEDKSGQLETSVNLQDYKSFLTQIHKQIDTIEGFLGGLPTKEYKLSYSMREALGRINPAKKVMPPNNYVNPVKFDGSTRQKLNELIEVYQMAGQIIRALLYRFETKYDSTKTTLLSADCKSLHETFRSNTLTLINMFNALREVLYNLQAQYVIHPIESDYLSKYLLQANVYSDFLYERFNVLRKVIDIDTVYVAPTSSNMKNYDLISLELEKKNKVSGHIEKYQYDIYIRGGIKVDFSAGIFGTNLINHSYITRDSLVDNKPTDKKMIKKVDAGSLNIGFGGMVNLMYRTGASWLSPGVSFGLIVSTAPSFQLTTSLTLAMGKTERLLVHAGYAYGFVKRLDNLPLDTYLPNSQIGETVATIDRFMIKPFFGLSYNLSKNNVMRTSFAQTASGN